MSQTIELDATWEPLLRDARPGDELVLRVAVKSTEVDLVEITALGDDEPQITSGERRVRCALLAVRS